MFEKIKATLAELAPPAYNPAAHPASEPHARGADVYSALLTSLVTPRNLLLRFKHNPVVRGDEQLASLFVALQAAIPYLERLERRAD